MSNADEGNSDGVPRSLSDILDSVEDVAKANDQVSVGDVVEALGRAGTAALIFLPAVVATTPLSGIPGLSALCGIMIALISAQAVIGRRGLWLPGKILRRNVEGDKLYDGLEKVRRPLMFLERHTHKRLSFLTTGIGARLLFFLCMLGGMTMPFLEVIPFSASFVAASVSLLTIAILTLDGALVVAAAAVLMLLVGVVIYVI
ncbi:MULTISPECIES: exopolysaccharide biosynthesis protein [unclassified Roseovarius]|uniref:exopolysaccharide biosynthesis protein n=1 Tax=unclassified Roseovarius TaxID=2614913 RepID=UPI00273FE3C4|nr:exopolysaccharide biosynthesis protein [Roseovarius sp. MMSF_3350]